MSFERSISPMEIYAARKKGLLKAKQAFEKAEDTDNKLESLVSTFKQFLPIIDNLFDNFYPHIFSKKGRENHLKPEAQLRNMLLSAYESVAFFTVLEREIDKEEGTPKRQSGHVIDGYRAMLPSATRVYKSNNGYPFPVEPEDFEAA